MVGPLGAVYVIVTVSLPAGFPFFVVKSKTSVFVVFTNVLISTVAVHRRSSLRRSLS